MNIDNFERYINSTILERGYDYYEEGDVIEVLYKGDNEYIFQVRGSENYEVVVNLDEKGEILSSNCNCPYDFGPVCKHEVAVYFKLFEILNSEDISIKKDTVKQLDIKDVLTNLSKEELINIIVDISDKDETLRNSIIMRYSKGEDIEEIEKCKNFIDSIVIKYTSEGFITYRQTGDFASEMGELLEKIRDTEDTLLALDIAFLLLEESIEAFQYADDSSGEIGFLVTETIGLIGDISVDTDDLDINLREELFNKLLAESDSKVFDGWEEYRIDLLRICTYFADVEILRNKLKIKIDSLVNKSCSDNYLKYNNECLLQIIYNMIEQYGTEEEAEQFIEDNLKFTFFRELYINKYIEEKDYHKAIELALEGEKQDKEYAGLISKWKKIRYIAYKKLSHKEEQEKLAKELLFDGNFEYYKELKELVTRDSEKFYNNLKQELKKNKGWQRRKMYLKLIVEENDIDEIMNVVRENPNDIEEYADMLVDKYKDEVIEIYKKHIKSVASSSSNRKSYQGVCRILKRYKKIAGKNNQEELIRELGTTYKRRPAFVDELSRIRH